METLYFTESGRKRKGAFYSCELCKNEFISRLNSNRKYCSQKCSRIASINREQIQCAFCKENFDLLKSRCNTKSGLNFCSRECKDKAQSLQHNILDIKHYGTGKHSRYSKRAKVFYGEFCEICGYQEHKEILEVHHIDFSRNNNNIENLIVLCPNHHAMITRGVVDLIDRKIIYKGS